MPRQILENDMRFSQHLHKPFQILWVEADQLSIFMVALTFAFMYAGFRGFRIIFWALPFVVVWGYSKLKKKYPRGFLNHITYFIGITKLEGYPDFFEDKFTE